MTVGNRNRSKDYNVTVTLRVDSVLYTGQLKGTVKQEKFARTLKAGTAQNIAMPVSYQEYARELSDQCAFSISCLASVVETEFEFFSQDDFRVRKPDILIKVNHEMEFLGLRYSSKSLINRMKRIGSEGSAARREV